MGLIKKVTTWSNDSNLDYISVNPTRDEITHYKVDPYDESDDSIVKLHTMKDFYNITCLDYSGTVSGTIGIGEKEGFVKIVNILTNETSISVRAKHRRCVNSIAMSSSGLVAMGLDRHKQDSSLQVWDVNYQQMGEEVVNTTFEFCVNESIVSLKFLNDISLIASSTKFLKEIDLRMKNPVYQHPTRLSYDIKLNPFNDWQFSTYGDDGTLAIWDRRNLAANVMPGDFSIASPLLTFEKLVGSGAASRKYMNSCFRWSTIQNGEFATLHRGDTIKRWRLGSYKDVNEDTSVESEELFVSTVHDIQTTFDRVATFDYIPKGRYKTSLICMRHSGTVYRMPITQTYSKTVFNFDNSLLLSNKEVPEIDELRVIQENEKSNLQNVKTELKNLSFEDLGLGDEYLSMRDDDKNSSDEDNEEQNDNRNSSHSNNRARSNSKDNDEVETNYDADEDPHMLLEEGDDFALYWKPERLLQKDISVIMKKRAKLGYGLDPITTVEMIDKSKALQNNAYIRNTWRWIAIAKASVDDGTIVSEDLDLGYEGILGIWNGLLGISNQNRYRQDTILSDKQLNREMEKIIKLRRKYKASLGHKSPISKFSHSPKHIQRRLCLIISGWDLSPSDYEEKYNLIMKNGHYEKAAAWAVFFGDIPKAIEILGSAKNERLRLIATAIAGYLAYKDEPGNNVWRQQCRKMSSELDDPYLRIIFAFIADNDWWDVLYEPAISLRERLGVALRFLNDVDLTRFLERTSSQVIANGELEGLILTGITPSGIDLLQSYVNKTSDVQTAALISICSSPRYFRDKRVAEWVSTYRSMLNSWKLFAMRARFDVLRTNLSRTSSGEITTHIKPRQLYIQCSNCKMNINSPLNNDINNNHGDAASITSGSYKTNEKSSLPNIFANGPNGNVSKQKKIQHKHSCPHCGTAYPRCAICLMPLGTSNLPFIINGVSGNAKSQGAETVDREDDRNIDERQTTTASQPDLTSRKLRLHEWFSFCLSCNHGMHAGHADEWFARHEICPTPGCSCKCNKF